MVITKKSSFLRVGAFPLLLIVSLVAAVCSFAAATPPADPKASPKIIKVVMDNNYPPYVFLDGKGNLQGILIDQWRLWEQKTGIQAAISGMNWGEALRLMEAGEFDVIDTCFFNEHRARLYDFSKPYAKIDVSIFFHKNISGISDANSLRGFIVAVKSGDNAIDHLRRKGISLFQEYPSYEAIIGAAKEHKAMVAVIDNPPALYFLYKMGISDQFRYSAPLYTGEFHRAVRKGNAAILRSVEEGFSRITESEYQAIKRRWFGAEARVFQSYLRPIAIGLGGLIIIVSFLIVWNRTLRNKVHERTLRLQEEIAQNIKKTEALQASEEKYRELVENANSIILRMDAAGAITFFNEYASRFLGFPRDEIIGLNVVGTIVPFTDGAGTDLAQMILDISVYPERYKTNENENTCKDGTRVWVAWTNKPILDDQGRCVEILCIGNDITELKRSGEALRESENRYRELVELAVDGILVGSHDGTIVGANSFMLHLTGRTLDTIIGAHISTLFSPKSVYSKPLRFDLLQEGEVIISERELVHPDGKVISIEMHTKMMPDGRYQSIFRDITSRKEAEAELAREREKLTTLSDNAPFGLVLIDREGSFTYINRKFSELFGFSLSDIPDGRTWYRKAYPDAKYRHTVISAWREDLGDARPGERRPRVFTVTCKEGTQRTVQFIPSVLISGDYLMTCEDITELRKLENQLRQAQKMESIGTLAGGIAHDFNNILTALMGYAALIQIKMDMADPLRSYVDEVLSASEKAVDLTQSLLAFSRQQPVNLVPLNMNNTITVAERLLRKLLTEDIEFRVSLTGDTMTVMADKSQVDQILFNLATNARDAMPKGGVLTITTAIATIDHTFIKVHGFGDPGEYVLLSISDTGEGMDELTRQKIFDPFFTTKEIGKGTGLGLATVYGIVKQHNGYIAVESVLNQGTTFHIYLPRARGTAYETDNAVVPVKGGKETILIAEDNEGVRSFMREALQGHGYIIREAIDGEDAVERFREDRNIDLIIIDSVMPKKNGREAYEEIHKIDPRIKAIFTSGYTKDVVLDKGIEEKEFDFIGKPLSLNQLLQKVREVLDR